MVDVIELMAAVLEDSPSNRLTMLQTSGWAPLHVPCFICCWGVWLYLLLWYLASANAAQNGAVTGLQISLTHAVQMMFIKPGCNKLPSLRKDKKQNIGIVALRYAQISLRAIFSNVGHYAVSAASCSVRPIT